MISTPPRPGMPRHFGIRIAEADKDKLVGELDVDDRHLNNSGHVHGGALAAFADDLGGRNEKAYLKLAQATVERKTSETEDLLMRRIDDPPNQASSPCRVRARGLPSSTVCIRLPALAGLIHLPFRKMRSSRPGIEPTAVAPPIAVDAEWRRPELAGLCKLHSTVIRRVSFGLYASGDFEC